MFKAFNAFYGKLVSCGPPGYDSIPSWKWTSFQRNFCHSLGPDLCKEVLQTWAV